MQTVITTVEKPIFRTGSKGKLFLLLKLNPTKELKQMEIDALAFDDLSVLNEGLGKNAKLKISFDKDKVPTIDNIIRKSEDMVLAPQKCGTCSSSLSTTPEGLFCENIFCPSTNLGFVYTLISLTGLTNRIRREDIKEFLTTYPVGETAAVIDTISEFKLAFNSIKAKNTQSRENQWKNTNPDNWEKMWELDLVVDEYLRATEAPVSHFWRVCNFPGITEDVFHELTRINPTTFLEGRCTKYKRLPKKARKYIEDNMDWVIWLNKFFTEFGRETWTE